MPISLFLVFISLFIANLGYSVFQLLFNLYLIEKTHSINFVSTYTSIDLFVFALTLIPASLFLPQQSMKKLLIGNTFLRGISGLGKVFFVSSPLFYVFVIVYAVSMAADQVFVIPFLLSSRQKKSTMTTTTFYTVLTLSSTFMGMLVGGQVPALLSKDKLQGMYQTLLIFLLLPFVQCLLLALVRLPESASKLQRPTLPAKNKRSILKQYMIFNGFIGLGAGCCLPYLNLFYYQRFHLSPSAVGFLFSLMQLSLIVSLLLSPFLGRRFGIVRTIFSLRLLAIPLIVGITLSNLYWSAAASILRNVLMNTTNPLETAFILSFFRPERHPLILAVVTVAHYIPRAVGSKIGGMLIADQGYETTFYITAGLYLVAILLFQRFFGRFKAVSEV